ncbi:high affinity 3',5'-cyclic-AMP phosphodiesterase 7A-like isoform X2 [Littorina saxatilis]|uniref:high affinity 3',5'-cyclic-AMP phosphodiesterase 7A-like isoform X2 n=1 Tax=Littorina saxatilis TaxID=31220 RepID=UPI0038B5FB87
MAMGPGGTNQLPALPLDQPVPQTVLNRRRDGVSFCSSSTYLTVPRYERRGGISYERADKNAIYVRSLGDGRMKGKTGLGDSGQLLEWERKLIEKLNLPECRMRFRSRFLSLHRVHRRRRPNMRLSKENKNSVDEYYYWPAQLLLTHTGDWDFNVFHLDTLTGGRSLLYLAYHIFREYGFIQRFQLDTIKLLRFFSSIEDNYHDSNPYHNIIHSTDVTQAMYCYLQENKLRDSVTPFEAMIAVLSAMAHDLDHPGVNQTFLVATANHLATLYQNTSVLEMHHWRYGVGLLQECGIFSHFSHTQWATAIWQFRSLILATDITRQQEFLLKFRRMIDEKGFDYESNLNSRHFILQIALKCADICNPCRGWFLSEKWSRQVCEEFFRQGDMERQVGVPVTPVCDRHANTVAKIQIGFMEVVVRPLFMEWKRFLPTPLSTKMLDNILTNKQNWQKISERDALSKTATVTAAVSMADSNSTLSDVSNRLAEGILKDGNRNNATLGQEEVCQTDMVEEEEEEEETLGEKEVVEFLEEEHHGEEADTVENTVNLAFHYQTDSEQASEMGSHSLPPVSEEEQLMLLAQNSRRRHSMPVVVRKDLGFYMGLRKDSFTRSNLTRRQSLPATPVMPSYLLAGTAGASRASHRHLSIEGLMTRPKISNLSSSVDTPMDYLSFLPLQSQTRLLQRGSWDPNDNDMTAASHPYRQSSSCMELRRRYHILKEDSERLKQAFSRMVTGAGKCHQELVGLASSWPSILRAGQKVDDAELKLLANQVGLSSSETETGSVISRATSNANSNNNVPACLSTSQAEGVSLLSRPH